jgi:hypothetical protein
MNRVIVALAVLTFLACQLSIFVPTVKANDYWVSPTGYADPDSKWTDEIKAYDENATTYAYSTLVYDVWSSFLYLTINAIQSNKVRWSATYSLTITSIDLDVYKNGEWVDVYQGSFANDIWNERTFVEGLVTMARVRFLHYGPSTDNAQLYEFDFFFTSIFVSIIKPQNITYITSSIPVQLSASGGTIDKIWYNCKNSTSWIYGSNQTYTVPTNMTVDTIGVYTFYAWANNTDGDFGLSTVVFSRMMGYTLQGLFDESTGLLKPPSERAVNVTIYFADGTSSTTFTVNGTYTYNFSTTPLYFHFNLGDAAREYWPSPNEYGTTIYIFDEALTTYTVAFLDLANILQTYPYVEAKRYINGSLMTVEKRKVDLQKKVVFNLKQSVCYTIMISGKDVSYTFGDLTFTDITYITLTLKAVDFPKPTLFSYKYVRVYGERALGTPNGTITLTYQDLLNITNNVLLQINYKNGTNVYNITQYSNSFIYTWSSALNDTDYAVVLTINHQQYGVYTWKQYFPRSFSTMPWGMDWFGNLPFNTAFLLPAFLIIFAGACFSVVNAYMGAFMMVIMAIIESYLGWLPISGSILATAFTFTIIMALIYAKKRIQT